MPTACGLALRPTHSHSPKFASTKPKPETSTTTYGTFYTPSLATHAVPASHNHPTKTTNSVATITCTDTSKIFTSPSAHGTPCALHRVGRRVGRTTRQPRTGASTASLEGVQQMR